MADVSFRRATPEDAHAVLAVKRAAIEELEHWQYTSDQVEVWAPKESYVDTFAEAIRDDRFVVRVAERGDEIVGYSTLTVPDERVDALYVHPDHQRLGIATSLLRHAEMNARFRGIDELDVVSARNAVSFYRSVGYWELDEEVATIEDVDVEFVRMRKTLATDPVGSGP